MGTPEFYRRFEEFITRLRESEFKDDFLDGNPTAVTHAYHAFLDGMTSEVRKVNPQNA